METLWLTHVIKSAKIALVSNTIVTKLYQRSDIITPAPVPVLFLKHLRIVRSPVTFQGTCLPCYPKLCCEYIPVRYI